jgi:lipid-A-disaccharide synthase-like uncharacterized protein
VTESPLDRVIALWRDGHLPGGWRWLGLAGAALFGSRWLAQVLASRRAGRPVITPLFWLLTLGGSATLVAYFLFGPHADGIGVFTNALPGTLAVYNLSLVWRRRGGNGPDG